MSSSESNSAALIAATAGVVVVSSFAVYLLMKKRTCCGFCPSAMLSETFMAQWTGFDSTDDSVPGRGRYVFLRVFCFLCMESGPCERVDACKREITANVLFHSLQF
uniref:Secreted protein n=1 Tax=Ascaris lumbricoides TaxID=6252 RepID=A0A0M3IV23_ASCLU